MIMFSNYPLAAVIALSLPLEPTHAEFGAQPFIGPVTARPLLLKQIVNLNTGLIIEGKPGPFAASAGQGPEADIQASAAAGPPALASWDHLTGAIRLHFANAADGLVLKYQPGAFQIAGADRKWYPADAHAFADSVIVSTSLVQNPVAVRYDWQPNSPAILFNKAGLPVARFRTDNWPDVTNDARPY